MRQAIRLLSNEDGLQAIYLEGLATKDESGAPADTWDGVDCTLYFGSHDSEEPQRVELVQLKYSAANPRVPWTVARLIRGGRRNSVIHRMAKAWKGLTETGAASTRVVLISNQPISGDLEVALRKAADAPPHTPTRTPLANAPSHIRLAYASGLEEDQFQAFASALELNAQTGSRFALEEDLLSAVAAWTDLDVRHVALELRDFVRRRMMPESANEGITRQSVLLHFGVSDERAMFPCRSEIQAVREPVSRRPVREAIEQLRSGAQYLCLHGEAGIGKTTALQEIEEALPESSVMVKYDCYGGGRYMEPSEFRHRPEDAFSQLTNELATRLRLPLLCGRSPDTHYPRLFKRRLEHAASALESQTPKALIVIAIDAADNAVTAAAGQAPEESPFTRDFLRLRQLPKNVRFIVTARTGRLNQIELREPYEVFAIQPFNEAETASHLEGTWPDIPWPPSAVEDFHHYSGGIPRVQAYALDTKAPRSPGAAVQRLLPSGKSLEDVFTERFKEALTKAGDPTDLKKLCAGLIALPRPVPLEALAAVLDCTKQQLVDLCRDLAPGVRLQDRAVGFADEDFETYVREEAQDEFPGVQARSAEWMLSQKDSSRYAASNVAGALHAAGRGEDLLALVESEPAPACIAEPVLRREVELRRLRLAARVCTDAGDPSRALRFILMSAEGARSEKALKELLLSNPDLAVRFAYDTVRRLVLSDPDLVGKHGPLLLHRLVVDADRGDGISARAGRRHLEEWLRARKHHRLKEPEASSAWRIGAADVRCHIEAQLKLESPAAAIRAARKWVPRHLALQTAVSLPYRLISEGRADLVKGLLDGRLLSPAAALFLLTPLALAGEQIDVHSLARGLDRISRRKLRIRDFFDRSVRCPEFHDQVLNTVLTACEILTIKGVAPDLVDGLLGRFLVPDVRRIDRRRTSETSELDLLFRAYALREARAGRTPEAESVFEPRPERAPDGFKPADRGAREHDRDLSDLAKGILDLYLFVARGLTNSPSSSLLESGFQKARPSARRLRPLLGGLDLCCRAAEHLPILLVAGYGSSLIKRLVSEARGRRAGTDPVSARDSVARLSLRQELHASLLKDLDNAALDTVNLRMAAGEKVETLASYARHARPLSEDDGGAIFQRAVDGSADLDHHVWAQIRLLDELVGHAGTAGLACPRRTAGLISDVVADAAIRLRDYRHFAWDHASSALARLDPPLALASAARWDEAGVGELYETLPSVLRAGLAAGTLNPRQVAALSMMWDGRGRILAQALATAERGDDRSLDSLAEEAAQDQLLGRAFAEPKALGRLVRRRHLSSRWCQTLLRQTPTANCSKRAPDPADRTVQTHATHEQSLKYAWTRNSVTDGSALQAAIDALTSDTDEFNQPRFGLAAVLEAARAAVQPRDRIAHLNAVSHLDLEILEGGVAASLLRTIAEWRGSIAVADWCEARLPEVIVQRFLELTRSVQFEREALEHALSLTGRSREECLELLFRAVEHHVHRFKPEQIFGLVSIIAARLDPAEVGALVDWYAARLAQRIPDGDRESPTVREIPVQPDEAIARFLFTYLGDPDVRLRWRAAHAVRRLARLHEVPTLKALVAQYGRRDEPAFREQRAGPFYWLAARLWFAVAWDRVAAETPKIGQVAAEQLLEIARDESLPHLLLRSFAKDACEKLVAAGCLELPHEELLRLRRVDRSGLPTEPEAEGRPSDPLRVSDAGLRFPFDQVDTIPYWYRNLIGAFARVSHGQFLREADHWIVDVWDHHEKADRAAAERERGRFRYARHGSTSHFHGSMPTLESLRRHLEWHAMWCAAGELLKSEPLVAAEEGSLASLYSLEDRLQRNKLTVPPLWSADLLCPTPRQSNDRPSRESPVAQWQRAAAEAAGPDRLLPDDSVHYVVVDGDEQRRAYDRHQRTRTRSALVEPSTARSLLRALQTIKDPWDYGLPFEGATDDREFDTGPFRLLAWLSSDESDPRIDEKDPLRGDASAIMCRPGRRVVNACRLRRDQHSLPQWSSHSGDPPMFTFEAWGTPERRHSNDGRDDGVSGHRLLAHKGQLQRFLSAEELDLICKVEVTRSARKDGYYGTERPDDQSPVRRARLYRLACNGSLEVAEGSLGTWREDRSTT